MALHSLTGATSCTSCARLGQFKHLNASSRHQGPPQWPSVGRFQNGGVAVSGWRAVAGQPGSVGHLVSHRCLSLSENADSESATGLEGPDFALEGEGEDGTASRGRDVVLSLLSNSMAVGALAITVSAVAMVWRNCRPGFVLTPTNESGQVYILNKEEASSSIDSILPSVFSFNEVSQVVEKISSSNAKSSRSLFFASTTLPANEGLTKLEDKAIDEAGQDFLEWLNNVTNDALNQGVSRELLDWALEDVIVSKEEVVKSKTMPEVKLTLDAYLKRMVDEIRVSNGASRLKENSEVLAEVSQKFGVPSQFIVAIWGIETNYGSFMGNWDIIQSLATMGFTEEKSGRGRYFRGELIEALVMLQKGTAERGTGPQGQKRLRGSWAGAMGQCQFMPTSFREYAIDFDGDGRKDIWESKADVFASIANYFKEHGWKDGGPIFQKVQVPRKLDKSLVGSGVVKSVLDWEHKHGVHLNPGKAPPLPPDEMASLLMPNGPIGDAYLVGNNFRVILRYNYSHFYGFAVCELARLIQERASTPYPTPQL